MRVYETFLAPTPDRIAAALPPGKRPFARGRAQAQPGKLGLMLRAH